MIADESADEIVVPFIVIAPITIFPVPDEEMPSKMTGCIAQPNYGYTKWGDLFNSWQKFFLLV